MVSAAITRDEYRALRADPARWRDAVVTVAARHGRVAGVPHPLGGSNLVAAIDGDLIVKLFPPFLRYQWESERAALTVLEGNLPLATPSLVHDGELDGWPYLVITRLDGVSLDDAWPRLDREARRAIMTEIGALIARVQAIDPGPLASLGPAWPDFVRDQRAACVARHTRLGLPAPLVAELDAYLDRAAPLVADDEPAVILTGEYTPENLLVAPDAATLVGLIDFGDAWAGPADYDLLGPATFLAAGDAALVRALYDGRGRGAPARDRLMAMLLLHRHSDLDVQIRIDGWRERARTLDELATLLFPP